MSSQIAVEEDAIQVGMPATFYIGTDRWATEVAEVVRFKTGPLAGKVKWVKDSVGRRFLRTKTPQGPKFVARWNGQVAYGTELIVGYAETVLDPSF